MRTHRTPEGLPEHALLDRAVLNLMLDAERQRPWAEDEIARALKATACDVGDSLRRLSASKHIHHWDDLATAAHAAVRYCEITQGPAENQNDEDERYHDKAVLEGLLVRAADGEGPRSEEQILNAHGARDDEQRLAITDALGRLEAAGLIERRDECSIASEVARSLDELMSV